MSLSVPEEKSTNVRRTHSGKLLLLVTLLTKKLVMGR
jgi:hypothetical protein